MHKQAIEQFHNSIVDCIKKLILQEPVPTMVQVITFNDDKLIALEIPCINMEKNIWIDFIRNIIITKNAVAATLIAESWVSVHSIENLKNKEIEMMPSKDPNRKECLLIYTTSIYNKFMNSYDIIRMNDKIELIQNDLFDKSINTGIQSWLDEFFIPTMN